MHDEALEKLDNWVRKNGWKGYDPYDIKGKKLFLVLAKNRYTDFAAHRFHGNFPLMARSMFGVGKEINPKAMCLFARAYIGLYRARGDNQHRALARECLEWLSSNPSPGYSGKCWGYPFDWQGRTLIPAGTPSVVVSSIGAHAFMDAHEAFGGNEYLATARGICDFIMKDLNRDETADALCFSYTPADRWHVHNANLFGASVLARVGAETGEEVLKSLAMKSMNFTVKHQNKDGSFYYWAPPDKLMGHVDNYHTGFVLECLNVCRRALGPDFKYERELKRGLDFYARELFSESGESWFSTKKKYPINIHSCAQGIITFKELADFDATHEAMSEKIAGWTMANMQDASGYFYHQIDRKGYVDRTPYIRWGQAWMMLALSHVAEKVNG